MNQKISIIVPVYNVQKELNRCVKSLINQSYRNIEIILVDDGSTDESSKICDDWVKQDDRIAVIHKQNGGLSDARNVGLKKAMGDYVLYIDSDDYIELDACENFIKAALEEEVDIIVGNAIIEKPNESTILGHYATPCGTIYDPSTFIKKAIKAGEWYAPAWLNMYRREYLLVNNLFFKQNRYFEDTQILPKVFLSAKKITCIDKVFYHYVIRENSIMTSSRNEKKVYDAIQNLREWKCYFDDVQDKELQKYLYGMLTKMYLYECRQSNITKWEIEGIDFGFAFKYALNLKEKLKTIFFELFPRKYVEVRKK